MISSEYDQINLLTQMAMSEEDDNLSCDRPNKRVKRRGYSLSVIKAGKTAMGLAVKNFYCSVRDFFSVFRMSVARPKEEAMPMATIDPLLQAEQRQSEQLKRFRDVRISVMQEVRQQAGLSDSQLSDLASAYDQLYIEEFELAYDNELLRLKKAPNHAIALWNAHDAVMPLCKDQFGNEAWDYSTAMHDLSGKIQKLLAQRTGIAKPAMSSSPVISADGPYMMNPPRNNLFPSR